MVTKTIDYYFLAITVCHNVKNTGSGTGKAKETKQNKIDAEDTAPWVEYLFSRVKALGLIQHHTN